MLSHARINRRLSRRSSSTHKNASRHDLKPAINDGVSGKTGTNAKLSPKQALGFAATEALTTKAEKQSSYKDSTNGVYFNSFSDLTDWYDRVTTNNQNHADNALFTIADELRIGCVPKEAYRRFTPGSIKLSVCHDFKGNYNVNEDMNPSGYYPHPSGKHYYLQFPSLVDHFIYFSHNLISVPTVSWINICHKLGLKCLGTIIFEGNTEEDYAVLNELCKRDEKNEFVYLKMLIKLVQHYKFDGFLLNIETKFSSVQALKQFPNFIEQLKAGLHNIDTESKLIWYDSFIPRTNKIQYENGLSANNFDLFKNSDYFLTNYWWDESNLKKNVAIAGLFGVTSSLYVGIDLFGRGTKIGNGGFDVPMAIQLCRAYDSNVCLFAPGWTYEHLNTRDFLSNDCKLWFNNDEEETVKTYVETHGVCCYHPFDYSKNDFIFYTNFNTGEGSFFNIDGKMVFNNNWVDLNYQFDIPDIVFKNNINKNLITFSVENKMDSFIGGSCLKISKNSSDIILDDSEDSKSINLNHMKLFKIEKEITCDKISVKANYKYSILNTNIEFDLDGESISNSEIADHSLMNGYFQLEIRYRIERRYKNTNKKIRDGFLTIPLEIGKLDKSAELLETSWIKFNYSLETPKMVRWEHCILEDICITWICYNDSNLINDDLFTNIYKTNIHDFKDSSSKVLAYSDSISSLSSSDDEWILLPDNAIPTRCTDLYIGDLTVMCFSENEISKMNDDPITQLIRHSKIDNKIYFKWEDSSMNNDHRNSTVLNKRQYFIIFINGDFVGLTYDNVWCLDLAVNSHFISNNNKNKDLVLRIDSATVFGEIIQGKEINIKI